ncbi:hypothetical protein KIH87_02910 [Paraneptunicella aestuarii]|uniref:hypothetical protein n=1 Tax=Paraneptunicella aestuarii TaxID=2831148 RepID=UPI001E431233|nr:hypothetical protein [Paraneptunicella aestuarii]UAA39331.1 hypothetical protein KIH87_02910 [Paraneptunicella aestuarii]
MLVDFVFRKKHSSTEKWIALEVKQNPNLSACLNGIMKDSLKIDAMRNSEYDLRCFWSLGVHKAVDKNVSVYDKLIDSAEKHNVEVLGNCFESHPIGNSGYAYLLC